MWMELLAKGSSKSRQELEFKESRQPFYLAAIAEHLRSINDPDAQAFSEKFGTFRTGVPVGVAGMPRVPEVFEAKEKWRRYDPVPWPTDKANYTSAVP